MPRFGLATLNHSPMHGHTTDWRSHLDAAADAGFEGLAPDHFWLRALAQEGIPIERIAKEMGSRELACLEIAGIGIGNVEQTRAVLEEHVRYADTLGAEFVNARIVESFNFEPNDPVIASVRRAAEVFRSVGTQVALEFSAGTHLRGVADAQRLIELADVPGLGVTIDTWHFFLARTQAQPVPDWAALDSLPVEWLANVQLSDGVGYAEGRFMEATMNERRMPGEGEFDLSRCAQTLAERGFDGPVIIEVLNAQWRNRPITEFASSALASARQVWRARPSPAQDR